MPKTIDPVLDRVSEAIGEARGLINDVRWLLPEPDNTGPQTGTIGRHVPDGSEPWNSAAADAYWNLWHGPSILVNYLRGSLGLAALRWPPKGHEAYDVLRKLVVAAPPSNVRYVTRKLERWTNMALRLPGIDQGPEPWTPVPAAAGATPPACPFCGTYALRMRKLAGQVRCFMPGCKDSHGDATRARMEPGRMTGEARLVFGDGTMMHWTGDV